MSDHKDYQSPFSTRYSSKKMRYLFSPYFRALTWRKLWIALAKTQKKLGLTISDKQIESLEKALEDIDFETVSKYEKTFKHEVMAHLYAYGEKAADAKPVLHLGATSCFVTDNADLIQMKEALLVVRDQLISVIRNLSEFAKTYADIATVSYTHLQPAQPTTVGKRACLWLQDYLMDLHDLEYHLKELYFLGVKGATGSQASFLSLFDEDSKKVEDLDQLITQEMGFQKRCIISSQTYSRKQDMRVFSVLQGIGSTSHKMANDIRLLSHFGEMQETGSKEQIGSSAMPHKKNPIYSERICGLSRFILSLNDNPAYTAATQWLERTLDDSANRRFSISEGFLATDAILQILLHLTQGWSFHLNVIEKNMSEHLTDLFLENVLMHAVKKGKDRQQIHHILHKHAGAARDAKNSGKNIDILELLSSEKELGLTKKDLSSLMDEKVLIGRSKEQVENFLKNEVEPVLSRYKSITTITTELHV